MSNPNKQKGTTAETRVRRFLEERCSPSVKVTRQALCGSKDQGDLRIETPTCTVIVEVKTGKQTANPNRRQLEEWKRQAVTETYNAMEADEEIAYAPALVVVRYNRKIQDADVYLPARDMHMWLDEFASYVYPEYDDEEEE